MGHLIAGLLVVAAVAASIAVIQSMILSDTRDDLNELRRWCILNGHAEYDVDLNGCSEFKLLENKTETPEEAL